MLPTFLVIGAMKGGTTALFKYLSGHPQVFMPECKETAFFVERFGWRRGLGWYEDLFVEAGDAIAVGEASPTYTCTPSLPGVARTCRDGASRRSPRVSRPPSD